MRLCPAFFKIKRIEMNTVRSLTIIRRKKFTACLCSIKVYIEDHASPELEINSIPCRKLGEIKNGQQATFQIDDEAAKLVIIADKASKEYCNEVYALPQGSEDITLTGENKLNPGLGNIFRFDGNDTPENTAIRKKHSIKGWLVLAIAVAVGVILGTAFTRINSVKEQVFSAEGMTITLTNQFEKVDIQGFTLSYDSSTAAMLALKESFAEYPGLQDMSLSQYGDAVIHNNACQTEGLQEKNGLTYFTYSFQSPEDQITYCYYTFLFKNPDAFWLVQFVCNQADVRILENDIFRWAGSISFN